MKPQYNYHVIFNFITKLNKFWVNMHPKAEPGLNIIYIYVYFIVLYFLHCIRHTKNILICNQISISEIRKLKKIILNEKCIVVNKLQQ